MSTLLILKTPSPLLTVFRGAMVYIVWYVAVLRFDFGLDLGYPQRYSSSALNLSSFAFMV